MDVHEAIRTKRAVRLFRDEPVAEDILLRILDAGRRSQSAKNTQPWQFIVVRDRAALKALSQTGDYAGHLAGAAFAVVLVGEAPRSWTMFDLGQAAAYMQLAAWELGVGSCIASIYHPDRARAILGIPDDKTADVALSFGYPSPDFVPARLGGRKPLEGVVRWEKWD
jgi:nitroreductase